MEFYINEPKKIKMGRNKKYKKEKKKKKYKERKKERNREGRYKKKEERKKERKKSLWPNTYIKYIQRFVRLSKYDYIRKMLDKNHLGKVPSKAAEC